MNKLKPAIERLFTFVEFYGRSITEIIDLIKDVFYAVSVDHASQVITVMLWFFSLFAIIFSSILILLMTQKQYIDAYGIDDLKHIEDYKYK